MITLSRTKMTLFGNSCTNIYRERNRIYFRLTLRLGCLTLRKV